MTNILLSALAHKFRGADLQTFLRAHAHCWLVWEPGVWKPPAKSGETLTSVWLQASSQATGEALAMALVVRAGRSGQLTVGRGAICDLEINDATLSHVHLLMRDDGAEGWTVRDAGSKNGSWLNEVPLNPGFPIRLDDGARVQAAQVCLTFHRPEGMLRRLGAKSMAVPASQWGTHA